MVKEGEGKISLIPIIKTLVRSVPFDAYITMTALSLLHISLPAPVITFSEVVSGANAFIAMLMMGVGFKISGDTSQKGKIVKILAVRYGVYASSSGIPSGSGNPALEPYCVCSAGLYGRFKGRLWTCQCSQFHFHCNQYCTDHGNSPDNSLIRSV